MEGTKRIDQIVVGTDFSEVAESAVDYAVELAKQMGASLTVVHAYELPIYSLPDGAVVSSADAAQKITTAALARLDAAVEHLKGRGVTVKSALRMGAPWEELSAVAAEGGAGLIVVGTHGRRGFSHLMLGSVAERTVRTASRPVLVIPAHRR